MKKFVENAAKESKLAELYDHYRAGLMKSGNHDNMDYNMIVNSFANAIIDECISVCLQQHDPQNLNYKPSERFAEAIRLHTKCDAALNDTDDKDQHSRPAHLDIVGRPIAVNDYVVYYSNVYQVSDLLGTPRNGYGMCRILLVDKSKTTKAVKKPSREMCKIDKEDVLIWKLK